MNRKNKTTGKPLVKCDQSKFKSTFVQMKKHIQNLHTSKPRRASKRLPVFTPISKPPKRSKPDSLSAIETSIISKGIVDDLLLLVSDEPAPFYPTNLEETDSVKIPADSLEVDDMDVTGLVNYVTLMLNLMMS